MISKKQIGSLASSPQVVDDSFVQIVDPSTDVVVETRIEAIARLVRGHRVLHVGCCDHIQLIDKKRAEGTWLHDVLCREADACVGVDINREAVDYVRSLGIHNVYCADLTKELPFDPSEEMIDFVVLGEIVEHLDSPVEFMRHLRANLKCAHQILVTVPNAFFIENFENAVCGYERTNSDHRFWFTPYTISKVLSNAGYRVRDIKYAFRGNPNGYLIGSKERRTLVEVSPVLRDVLIVVAETKGAEIGGETDHLNAEAAPDFIWARHDIGERLVAPERNQRIHAEEALSRAKEALSRAEEALSRAEEALSRADNELSAIKCTRLYRWGERLRKIYRMFVPLRSTCSGGVR